MLIILPKYKIAVNFYNYIIKLFIYNIITIPTKSFLKIV